MQEAVEARRMVEEERGRESGARSVDQGLARSRKQDRIHQER